MAKPNGAQWFQIACMALLWLALCYVVVAHQPFTLRVAFIIVASGIIVFVPIYKKYFRHGGK